MFVIIIPTLTFWKMGKLLRCAVPFFIVSIGIYDSCLGQVWRTVQLINLGLMILIEDIPWLKVF